MKPLVAVIGLFVLAGCGADGEPIPPSMNANVGIGAHGASGSAGMRLGRGPFTVGLGVGT